jgi:hypothetical protein
MGSEGFEPPDESTTGDPAPAQAPHPTEEGAVTPEHERTRLERYNEVLLTASSILAGFAMTGLLGLPEVGQEGIARLSAALFFEPSALTFPTVYFAMLVATVCFLGVMVAVITGRLRVRRRRLEYLRSTYRASVLVFGVGLSALFCATVSIGVPTHTGFLVGLGGGATITLVLFVNSLRL